MGIEHHGEALDRPRDHGGDRRAPYPEGRRAETAEDQHPVEGEVRQYPDEGGQHRRKGIPRRTESAAVNLRHRIRDQGKDHNTEVFLGKRKDLSRIASLPLVKIERNEAIPEERKNKKPDGKKGSTDIPGEAEDIPHPLAVTAAVCLRRKDPCARHHAKEAPVEHKKKLIDDRDPRHFCRTEGACHHIIQRADEIADDILRKDRQHHGQRVAIKRPISDIPSNALHTVLSLRFLLPSL